MKKIVAIGSISLGGLIIFGFTSLSTAFPKTISAASDEMIGKTEMYNSEVAQKQDANRPDNFAEIEPYTTISENPCKTIDKDYIYYHCLNTLENLHQLSGSVVIRNGNQFPCTTEGDFVFDFTNERFFANQVDRVASTGEVAGVYEFYNEHGAVLEKFDYRDVDLELDYKTAPEKIYYKDNNGPTMDGVIFASESGDVYSTMYCDPTNAHMLAGCFMPQELSVGYLENFDNWEITELQEFEGRQCAVINGKADPSYGKRFGVDTFTIMVDIETGIWMQYEGYDADGAVQDYIYTSDIKFDEAVDAVPNAQDADLVGYEFRDSFSN